MHRSGTSLLTRLLNLMGVYLGPEGSLLLPAEDNVKGFWERVEILEMHEAILERMGMSWYRVAGFDPNAMDAESEKAFSIKVPQFCYNIDSHRPWALKDPRLCLFFSRWKPYLEVPLCVFMYRHPLQVARSLAKRNSFSVSFGLALWEFYNVMAVQSMIDCPNFILSFDELMQKPVSTGRKILAKLRELGVQRINLPSSSEIKSFISSNLVHHKSAGSDDEAYITCRQQAIFDHFQKHEYLESFPFSISPHALNVIKEYQEMEDTKKKLEYRGGELKSACADKTMLQERLDGMEGERKELESRIQSLEHARTALEQVANDRQQHIEHLTMDNANLRNMLQLQEIHLAKLRSDVWYAKKQ